MLLDRRGEHRGGDFFYRTGIDHCDGYAVVAERQRDLVEIADPLVSAVPFGKVEAGWVGMRGAVASLALDHRPPERDATDRVVQAWPPGPRAPHALGEKLGGV